MRCIENLYSPRVEEGDAVNKAAYYLGMVEDREWTVKESLEAQGLTPCNEMQNLLGKIPFHPRLAKEETPNPRVQERCRMALYDLDRFRRFVLESRFLQTFYVEKNGDFREGQVRVPFQVKNRVPPFNQKCVGIFFFVPVM